MVARLLGRHAAWCGCPLCDRDEREMRAMLGMAALHPELLARELPAAQEEELAALASEAWPDDEWTLIIIEARRAEGQA
jgi:hypothetical protein